MTVGARPLVAADFIDFWLVMADFRDFGRAALVAADFRDFGRATLVAADFWGTLLQAVRGVTQELGKTATRCWSC